MCADPVTWPGTCFDGVFKRRPAADQNIIQGLGFIRKLPVVPLQQLVGVMEINHFGRSVERLHDVREQNIHHFLQERHRLQVSVQRREEICGEQVMPYHQYFSSIQSTAL